MLSGILHTNSCNGLYYGDVHIFSGSKSVIFFFASLLNGCQHFKERICSSRKKFLFSRAETFCKALSCNTSPFSPGENCTKAVLMRVHKSNRWSVQNTTTYHLIWRHSICSNGEKIMSENRQQPPSHLHH